MTKKNYRYIYGPVHSWRLGASLGIDLLSGKRKACNFDCLYCQLGQRKPWTKKRSVFVPTANIIEELNSLPPLDIDYITFSGMGEPTLARNLGHAITAVKKLRREKVAVLTNAALIHRADVQKDLRLADFVIAKIDACNQEVLMRVNRPPRTILLDRVLKGIRSFMATYQGRIALQIMLIKDNKHCIPALAAIVRAISPDEVQLNTPLRPCRVQRLSKKEIAHAKTYFRGLPVVTVYDTKRRKVQPLSKSTAIRRRTAP
jgi:wyosine [tRNA(Phe)-imidazoG37] synthetase (radical SAM superfamily)